MSSIIVVSFISIVVLSVVPISPAIDIPPMATETNKDSTFPESTMHENINLLRLSRGGTVMSKEKEMLIFDFTTPGDLEKWRPINDTVMGGISNSQLKSTKEGTVLFTGNVSLENYGGFASLQSQPSHYNFTGYEGIDIRVKGDGKRYKFSLKTNEDLDSPRYEAAFNTDKGSWTTIRIPFNTLVPTFRGTILNNAPPLDVSKVRSFGVLISDKQEGPFRLEIDWIKAYQSK